MKTVIEMAREAGFYKDQPMYYDETMLADFAALVREDEQEKICSLLRQIHDSISLQSKPSGFSSTSLNL